MRVPAATRRLGLDFNITPLIDVVFLLNIFFLVASYYLRHGQVDPVELPLATQGEHDDRPGARLVVSVLADGTLSLAGRVVTREEVSQELQAAVAEYADRAELRLRCDRAASYRAVEPLLLSAAQHGVRQVQFAVTAE
jgi:biopolymer transport protein ExbD